MSEIRSVSNQERQSRSPYINVYLHDHLLQVGTIEAFIEQFKAASMDYRYGDIVALTFHDTTLATSNLAKIAIYYQIARNLLLERGVIPLFAIEVQLAIDLPKHTHKQTRIPWWGYGQMRKLTEEIFHAQIIAPDMERLMPLIHFAMSDQFKKKPWQTIDGLEKLLFGLDDLFITANHLDHNSPEARERIIDLCHKRGYSVEIPDNWFIASILHKFRFPLPPAEQKRSNIGLYEINKFDTQIPGSTSGTDSHMQKRSPIYQQLNTKIPVEANLRTPEEGLGLLAQAYKEGSIFVQNTIINYLYDIALQLGYPYSRKNFIDDLQTDPNTMNLPKRQIIDRIRSEIEQLYNDALEKRENRVWGPLLQLFERGLHRTIKNWKEITNNEMWFDARSAIQTYGWAQAIQFMISATQARPGKRVPTQTLQNETIFEEIINPRPLSIVYIGGFLQKSYPYLNDEVKERLEKLLKRRVKILTIDPTNFVFDPDNNPVLVQTKLTILPSIAKELLTQISSQLKEEVILIGFSLGGALCLEIANQNQSANPNTRIKIAGIHIIHTPLPYRNNPIWFEKIGIRLSNHITPLWLQQKLLKIAWNIIPDQVKKKHHIDKEYFMLNPQRMLLLLESFYNTDWIGLIGRISQIYKLFITYNHQDHTTCRFDGGRTLDVLKQELHHITLYEDLKGREHNPPDLVEAIKRVMVSI